ncbi:MAG: riboflavin kinase [Candidatus Doudnabacteria bacterium]|nr:riboflavin kinase [Candidatus Doudnabacteria bacterium]
MIQNFLKKKEITTISGRVVKGQQYGRVLGFPTANLDRRSYSRRKLNIKLGVYAGMVKIEKLKIKNYLSGIVIGPIERAGLPKIEAHLIGYNGSLYGKKLNLSLLKYLRPFKKFKNEAELKKQIRKDIQRIRKLEK